MRYLKNKITQSKSLNRIFKGSSHGSSIETPEILSPKIVEPIKPAMKIQKVKKMQTTPTKYQTKESTLKTKNLVRNYAKAICNFATGPLAQPYIVTILRGSEYGRISVKDFMNYACEIKRSVDGMQAFKSAIEVFKDDEPEQVELKMAFRAISKVFIDYFSVNWIYSSKLSYKQEYVNYRYKILRRIQHPELFTYMKSFKKSAKK